MNQKFKIGELVIDKESGKKLRIVYDDLGYFCNDEGNYHFNGIYRCCWIGEDGSIHSADFAQDQLKKSMAPFLV
ncbi:MAG TPA: hypothetical protein VHO50_10910 [Bacteroidales bacterium]|nr:hypothetical protein [Bacteroidales bacterium]